MVKPKLTTLLLGPVDIAWDRRHFEDFRKILLPNIGEDQTKSHYDVSAEHLGLCHMVNPALDIALRS